MLDFKFEFKLVVKRIKWKWIIKIKINWRSYRRFASPVASSPNLHKNCISVQFPIGYLIRSRWDWPVCVYVCIYLQTTVTPILDSHVHSVLLPYDYYNTTDTPIWNWRTDAIEGKAMKNLWLSGKDGWYPRQFHPDTMISLMIVRRIFAHL